MRSNNKPKIAFFDFTGCEGCQLTVVDALQSHPELLDAVEIVQFREAMSERGEDYEIAFIEGSYSRKSDDQRLKRIRDHAKVVVALGACAYMGGVNALRNNRALDDLRQYVYADQANHFETGPALPIASCIDVDAFIPGCPIDRLEFIRSVRTLLQGNLPVVPDYPVCVECKLAENECTYLQSITCLGPIVRAGCGALCPSFGTGCEGCRGIIPDPNIASLKEVMGGHNLSPSMIEAKLSFFMTYELMKSGMVHHDNE